MGKIFYIMGKSASGKDHIYAQLIENPKLNLKSMTLYTTRPIRVGEVHGKEYYFVDHNKLEMLRNQGKIIEERGYDTIHGVWTYFTADDGQIDLEHFDYLGIGTLESYHKLREYYGEECICPIYVDVEDGIRLERALKREKNQKNPKYAELCRRFLADSQDFKEENLRLEGITRRFYNDTSIEECVEEIETYILQQK